MNKNDVNVTEIVARAFRAIGQPDINGLIFVCESDSIFSAYDSIIGIPVYSVPSLDIRGGLLLASKDYRWDTMGKTCIRFQSEMEIQMYDIEEDEKRR